MRATAWSPWLLFSLLAQLGDAPVDEARLADLLRPACGDERAAAQLTRENLRVSEYVLRTKPLESKELRKEIKELKRSLLKHETAYRGCVARTPPAMSEEDARKQAQADQQRELERAMEKARRPKEGAIAPMPVIPSAAPDSPGTSRGLDYGSAADAEAFLNVAAIKINPADCRNPRLRGAVTRAVMCLITITPAGLAAIAEWLPLTRGEPRHPGPDYSDSCESTANLGSRSPGVEVWTGTNAKLTNGVGRVAIHFDRSRGRACIEIEYPWS